MRALPFLQFARHNLGKIESVVIVLAIAGAIITLSLAGSVRPETIRIIDATKSVAFPYGEPYSGSVTGYSENFSGWKLGPSGQINTTENSLVVRGSFQNFPKWTSVVLLKNVNIDITAYPILDFRANVTRGVRYGIRFFAQYSNGTEYNAWWEASALDHRQGVGYEMVRANMQRQTFLATGRSVDRLSKLEFYIEDPPNTRQDFQFALSKLSFLKEQMISGQSVSGYRAVYVDLSRIPSDNSSWYLDKINLGVRIQATPGTVFTAYLFDGSFLYGSTTASGIPYIPLTSFSEYTFYPDIRQQLFPELLPGSNVSFVFVASSGSLADVEINYVHFVFLPTKDTPIVSQQSLAFYYAYFLFFLFLLPVGLAILVFREFFSRQTVKISTFGIVLVAGFVCRVALAATTAHVFDTNVYLASARGWFQFRTRLGSLGPTLPFTFFLYWVAYSPYAILQLTGFRDLELLGHAAGPVEGIFVKLFPILMDTLTFFLLLRLRPGGRPFVWATFYFLNPLSIFVSSVWGQYESATMSFILWGTYWLWHEKPARAALAFVTSGMIQLLGFLPYALLLTRTARARSYRTLLKVSVIPLIILVYLPEADLIFRLFLSLAGYTRGQFSQPGSYSLLGSFPQLATLSMFNPLLVGAGVIIFGVCLDTYRRQINGERIVLYTAASSVVLLLFSDLLASWLWLLPTSLMYAIMKEKNALGAFMLVFGTAMTFLIVSNTTGSAYLILGNVGYAIQPAVEAMRNQLKIFTVMSASLAGIFLFYLKYGREKPSRTLVRTSGIALSMYLLLYFWLAVYQF